MKLLELKPNFVKERQQQLRDEFNKLRAERNQTFQHQVNQELNNSFFSLLETQAFQCYSDEKHSFELQPDEATARPSSLDEDVNGDTSAVANAQLMSPMSLVSSTQEDTDFLFSPFGY